SGCPESAISIPPPSATGDRSASRPSSDRGSRGSSIRRSARRGLRPPAADRYSNRGRSARWLAAWERDALVVVPSPHPAGSGYVLPWTTAHILGARAPVLFCVI